MPVGNAADQEVLFVAVVTLTALPDSVRGAHQPVTAPRSGDVPGTGVESRAGVECAEGSLVNVYTVELFGPVLVAESVTGVGSVSVKEGVFGSGPLRCGKLGHVAEVIGSVVVRVRLLGVHQRC